MKTLRNPLPALFGLALALLFEGCVYEVPLADEANIPINHALLGTWTLTETGNPAKTLTAVVTRLSDTEYVVATSAYAEKILCYRAWPVELDGVRYLQLEMLDDGTFRQDVKPYLVCKLVLDGDKLDVDLLTLDGDGLSTPAALRQALRDSLTQPDLFKPLYTGARMKRVIH